MTFDDFLNSIWYNVWTKHRKRMNRDRQLEIFGECVSDFEKRYTEENK